MYQRFFGSGNPLWAAMGRLFDVVELNVLWVLFSLPIVTIGASTTAFYGTAMSLVRGEETTISHDFFHAFCTNLRKNIVAGLLAAVTGAFLLADVMIAYRSYQNGGKIYLFFMVFFFVILLLWGCVVQYLFPLLARVEDTLLNTLIRAFSLSLQHLPQTLLMLALKLFAFWVCHLTLGAVFVIFGVLVEIEATLFCAILKPWLPPLVKNEE